MTVQEYNNWYSKDYSKALSFLNCLDHALEKCDDNARLQLELIGYGEDTKVTLRKALEVLREFKRLHINGREEKNEKR